jgi:glycosyltransferase involved in cell wall biosynthesis
MNEATTATTRTLDDQAAPLLDVRRDLLVHALAQLSDDVSLKLAAPDGERLFLERLVAAYAIGDRVSIRSSGNGTNDERGTSSPTMAELLHRLSRGDDLQASLRHQDDLFDEQRIALVTNLPAPYRLPLFERMAERLTAGGAAFKVFFLSTAAGGRSWMDVETIGGFEQEVLRSVGVPIRKRRPLIPLDLERRLAAFRPTLVLAAGLSPAVSGRAARFASRRRVPFGIWSGEHSSMGTARHRLRRLQRRRLVASADFAIAYGFEAAEYLRDLSPTTAIVYGRNTAPTSPAERDRDPRGQVEMLAVGDLASPRKGIDVAIEALRQAPNLRCRLTVIGGGSLLEPLRERARDDRRVRFLGSLATADVHAAFEASDVFLFPSRADVFGLALVEAMAAGLAIVTSDAPGAVSDLCVHEYNSIVMDTFDPASWARVLGRLVDDAGLCEALGSRARETIVRRWTIDHAADAMIAGLRLGVLTSITDEGRRAS